MMTNIHKRAIPKFAANIKRVLRDAYDIKKNERYENSQNYDKNEKSTLQHIRNKLNALPASLRRQFISEIII